MFIIIVTLLCISLFILILVFTTCPNEKHIISTLLNTKNETQIRVKFFSDICDSETIKKIFINNFIGSESKPNRIEYVSDDTYTHCVIVNTAMPSLKIPKENVIGIAFEPPHFLNLNEGFKRYAEKNISKYYIGDNTGLNHLFICHIGFIWHCPFPQHIPFKNKLMSIIFSDKKELQGHKYRHELINQILTTNLPIDIWGRGCEHLTNREDARIQGGFADIEPYENYQYTIAIENCALEAYVSEKFFNALLYETVPLYYGAKCVDTLFENKFLRLTGDITVDFKLIQDVCINPSHYHKKIDRYKVAKEINIGHHLNKIFLK